MALRLSWEGHLPRLLFSSLDRPLLRVKCEISGLNSTWTNSECFHVTKRRYKALDMDVLVHDGGYYRVNPDMAIHMM
jgi:hypothetical protein